MNTKDNPTEEKKPSRFTQSLRSFSEAVVLFLTPVALFDLLVMGLQNFGETAMISSFLPFILLAKKILYTLFCGFIGFRIALRSEVGYPASIASFITILIATQSVYFASNVVSFGVGNFLVALVLGYFFSFVFQFISRILRGFFVLFGIFLFVVPLAYLGTFVTEYAHLLDRSIAELILGLESFHPFLMGGLVSICFAFLVCSPLSTISIATLMGVAGTTSGAASVGISFMAISIFLMSVRGNGILYSFLAIFGGPKVFLPNFVKKPYILLPYFFALFFLGGISAISGFKNTILGAGTGIVNVTGFFEALTVNSWMITSLFLFIFPFVLGFFVHIFCIKILKLYTKDDLKIEL